MKHSLVVAGSALLLVGLAACKPAPPPPPTAPPTVAAPAAAPATLFEVMNGQFAPQSDKLWELAGNLYNDKGDLDAKQLTDAQWQELNDNATKMRDVATQLADAASFMVAPAGVKLLNEGTGDAFNAAQVQAAIDANPQGFKDQARALSAVAADFLSAAVAHDATKADAASNRLNEVCTACHTAYWYPNQHG